MFVMSSPPITSEQLAALSPEFQAILRAVMEHYEQRIAELKAELAALKKTPRNSSLPPSTQHPHAKASPARKTSRKKRGGQSGHQKCQRPLIPTQDCTSVVTVKPKECRRCGSKLSGTDQNPLRHQVWELPEIQPIITEYQQYRLTCSCGTTTCGALPSGVPTGQSGPRLIAFTATLMAHFRQSKRRAALFISSVLNIPCCASLTVKHQNIATLALRKTYESLVNALRSQPHLHGDESPTKQGTLKSWLWTFVAKNFTVFALRGSRSATTIQELLGETFPGVMNCDRAKMYWRCGKLQWCWAHLKRDIQALIDRGNPQVKRLGHDLMKPVKSLFRQWARCRDGTLSRQQLPQVLSPVRDTVNGLLLRGYGTQANGMCRELYSHRGWLWTFLETDGVEPTNNAAERSLRHAVIWRKLSFGTQSASGSRFVETLLSVIETCRQQNRNVLSHITDVVTAHFNQKTPPSLLPRL